MSDIFIFLAGIGAGMVILAVILFLMLLTGKLELLFPPAEWPKDMERLMDCDDQWRKSDEQIKLDEADERTRQGIRATAEGIRENREHREALARLTKTARDGCVTVKEALQGIADAKKIGIRWESVIATGDNVTKKYLADKEAADASAEYCLDELSRSMKDGPHTVEEAFDKISKAGKPWQSVIGASVKIDPEMLRDESVPVPPLRDKVPGCLGHPPAGMIPKAVVAEMVENSRCGIPVPVPS